MQLLGGFSGYNPVQLALETRSEPGLTRKPNELPRPDTRRNIKFI